MLASLLASCVMLAPVDAPPLLASPTADSNIDAAALLRASQQALEAANAARDAALALQKFAEAEAPKPPPPNWIFSTTGRLENVSGNATAFSGGVDGTASGTWRDWTTDFKLSYSYGHTTGTPSPANDRTTANQFLANARGERKFTETFGGYALLGFLTDRVASIQDQEYGELGVSNTWIDTTREDMPMQRLRTSVGFRATREAHGNFYPPAPVDPADAVRWIYAPALTVSYRLALTSQLALTEDATVLFDVQAGKDIRAQSETALNVQLSSHLAVALNFKVRYLGRPAEGRRPNDTILGSSVTWSW